MDEYYRVIQALPPWLAQPLAELPPQAVGTIHELRLRVGSGVALNQMGRQGLLEQRADCPPALRGLRLTAAQMEEILYALCDGSVHTHQTELAEGYLTTRTGCRVGIGGQFAEREGGGVLLQAVSSFNFRIARVRECRLPAELLQTLQQRFTGMLLIGEPDSGKTTLLRQIARTLAGQDRLVSVLDERGELFPPDRPDAAEGLDRIAGLPKARAVQMALRTLAPQVILLDELGSLRETAALEQGFWSGVDFIASVHASGPEDALRRPQVQYLQRRGMLQVLVVLAGRTAPGRIREVRRL